MTARPTWERLYASAVGYAHGAIDAFGNHDHSRSALEAGTAIEHLAKACLAKREVVPGLVELEWRSPA